MISIVTIAHNQRLFTEMLLKSLKNPKCADQPFDLVFIDNGSTDGTEELVKQYSLKQNPNFMNLSYFSFPENKGVAAAINKGFAIARRDLILQADNDVVFGPGSFSIMAKFFKQDTFSMISPNWPWIQKKLGTAYFKNAVDMSDSKLKKLNRVGLKAPLEHYRATGSCWMCSKELFDQVKGWDEGYKNICASDDFLVKIAQSGAKRFTIPCPVYHPGKITRGTIPNNSEQQEKDLARFNSKWGGHPEDKELFRAQQIKAGVVPDPPRVKSFFKKLLIK